MPTQLTGDFLKQYLSPTNKRHPAYADTVKLALSVRIHSDGDFPKELIGERRPGESETIKKYREAIYKSKTKGAFGKVHTEIGKIRKSEDWLIKYDETKRITTRPGESLYDYCELNFPLNFGSVTNWAFNILQKNYEVDPNAVILVMPMDINIQDNEYLRPFPFLFNSENVYDYLDEDYAVLYSTDKSTYTDQTGQVHNDGMIFYAVNTQFIDKWEQFNVKGEMKQTMNYAHGLGRMPAFKIGASFFKVYEKHFVFESRLANAIPSWDEAVREYSDLQAEVVQHIHSLMWSYTNQICKNNSCTGGKIFREGKDAVGGSWDNCPDCKGTGYIPFNPYEHMTVRPASATEQALPNPFVGYVTKDTKIVEIQDKRVKDHIYDGYAALNMEFLADTPMNESGKAKEVDRDGLNTFVSTIAEDIVRVIDDIYELINDYRYTVNEANADKRKAQLPNIPVPQKFDLLSSTYILQELTSAKESKANPSIIAALEIEYANAKFNNDAKVRDMLISTYDLDPFPGLSDEDKMSRLQNDGISQEDYVISSNISSFVRRAIHDKGSADGFVKLPYEEKKKLMVKYAKEIVDKNSAKAELMIEMQQAAMGAPGVGKQVEEDAA